MQILFAISLLCFLVLAWAAVAITRRVRASHKFVSPSDQPQREFGQYLFAAVEREHAPLADTHQPPGGFHNISFSNNFNLQSPAPSRAGFVDKATSYHRD